MYHNVFVPLRTVAVGLLIALAPVAATAAPGIAPGAAVLPAGPSFTAVAAGGEHTCAVDNEGAVLCWGSGSAGQLGDGSYTDRSTARRVASLEHGVKAVAAGWKHSCALASGGGVWCWGANHQGQLGDGSTLWSSRPKQTAGLESGVRAITAGDSHTCALTETGQVWCWGQNDRGQLGDGTTTPRKAPVAVIGLETGVAAIAAGWYHTCALTQGGGVLCWGWNGSGQLGDGTYLDHSSALPVQGLESGVAAIATGRDHTCALTDAGDAFCWGSNGGGRLGAPTINQSNIPVPVEGLPSAVVSITAGHDHTCAVTGSGGALCWGYNGYGQLGDGTYAQRLTPVPVLGLDSGVVALAAGWQHTCAVTDAGPLCWGDNWAGQVGDGTALWRAIPAAVPGLGAGALSLTAGWTHTCTLTGLGGVACWGSNPHSELGDDMAVRRGTPLPVLGLESGVKAIGSGWYHACAVTGAGAAWCWGGNWNGALGNGTYSQSSTPVPVTGLGSGAEAIVGGSYHTCALVSDGGVLCWGANGYGQLGDGTKTMRSTPAPVSGLDSGMAAVAAGGNHNCALTASGGAVCWGSNSTGQLGGGTTTDSPVPIAALGLESGVTTLALGSSHTCALTGAGGVWCWGYNGYGQLGDGTTTWRYSPVAVPELQSGAIAIAAGQNHTCAATSSGRVWCWGSNQYGQLGDVTTTRRYSPVPVQGLVQRVTALVAGGQHTCALTDAAAALCWGWDGYGQLGLNTVTIRSTPVEVVTRQFTSLPLVQR